MSIWEGAWEPTGIAASSVAARAVVRLRSGRLIALVREGGGGGGGHRLDWGVVRVHLYGKRYLRRVLDEFWCASGLLVLRQRFWLFSKQWHIRPNERSTVQISVANAFAIP